MTPLRTRFLAAAATAFGLICGGFDAHLAPQGKSWWHGLTGSPSLGVAVWALSAAVLVWALGRVVDVKPFVLMSAGLLPLVPAILGWGAPLLVFSIYTTSLLFAILLGFATRGLLSSLPRIEPLVVFCVSFAFFVFVGRFLPGPAGPQGDEPHYLLIAESLLTDGDVDLKNQFDERAFTKFTSANLEPHAAPRSPAGRLYSVHAPGVSALVAPGYAAFGFAGARAVVSLVMAAVVSLLFFASRCLFGEAAANFVFLLSTFASPLPIYANSVFPDSVATLAVAAALSCLVSPRPAFVGLASVAIASLPWMHPRFLPLAFLLALAIACRGGLSWGRAAAIVGPLLGSVVLLLVHFQSLFGKASLSAAYGPNFASDVSLARIPWGASALIMDRQFGLLLFAPILWLGLAGLAGLWKRDRLVALAIVATAGVLLGTGGAFSMWWGGASAPARFLIGATPALLLLCGGVFQEQERRSFLGTAAGFGLGLLGLACLAPRALHNRADGDSGLLRLLAPTLDLDRLFPSFVNAEGWTWLAFLWAVVLVVCVLRPRVGVWTTLLPMAFALLGSERPLLDPFAASLRALESWGDRRLTLGGNDTEAGFTLDVPLGPLAADLVPGVELYSPRFSLPKGLWTLQAESRTEPGSGALNVGRISLVTADEELPPLASLLITIGDPLSQQDFDLAGRENRVHLKGEGLQLRTRILKVTLVRRASAIR